MSLMFIMENDLIPFKYYIKIRIKIITLALRPHASAILLFATFSSYFEGGKMEHFNGTYVNISEEFFDFKNN